VCVCVCRLTWVVPDKGPLNGCVCVFCVTMRSCVTADLPRMELWYFILLLPVISQVKAMPVGRIHKVAHRSPGTALESLLSTIAFYTLIVWLPILLGCIACMECKDVQRCIPCSVFLYALQIALPGFQASCFTGTGCGHTKQCIKNHLSDNY